MLFEQDFEIKEEDNSCSIYLSNEFYDNIFLDNDLLFLSLNVNFFMFIK